MKELATRLTLLVGPTLPVPAPPLLMESLESVEVTHKDGDQSGFQITFRVGKSPRFSLDLDLLQLVQLRAGNRLILQVTLGASPKVLMDGFITRAEYKPGNGSAGPGKLLITGKDVSFAMERKETNAEHPAQSDYVVANKILASYARYGVVPLVIPPTSSDAVNPTDRTPVQTQNDFEHLKKLAAKYRGWVFHVTPGLRPGVNKAYWGPTLRAGIPQAALSVDMGSDTNVDTIDFENDAAEATQVRGKVQDRKTGLKLPVVSVPLLGFPLAVSAALANTAVARTEVYRALGGRSLVQALGEAQATTEKKSSDVVSGSGELDTGRYGGLIEARCLIGVRGVGLRYDGLYYVKSVTHKIQRSSYKQAFEIVREGTVSTVPAVPVRSLF